ncbi:MAG: cysteine desulfurase family protein [Candidatus Omnitrophota bacterium]|jgi:cysteine desulfurase
MIYLDYNSTTLLDKEVLKAMKPYLTREYANPSSVYHFSQRALKAVCDARLEVARSISAKEDEIIFTSGGTESNNLAIKGVALSAKSKGKHIITSKIEHHSVLNPCKFLEERGFNVTYLNVDSFGVVDLGQLEKSIMKETVLVSIMHANNETGTIQPIEKIAKICKAKEVLFHTDAVQSAGKIPLDVNVGIDMLSISAHKFCGPKGVGALYLRKGIELCPLMHGGHQERDLRAGTENVSGIVGLGKAFFLANSSIDKAQKEVTILRERFKEGLKKINGIKLNGHPQKSLYNTLNVSIEGIDAASLLVKLDLKGICISAGSACMSGSLEPSHVLLAMGLGEDRARASIRVSLGKYNTEKDIDRALKAITRAVFDLRKAAAFNIPTLH